jgi:hypothetical protein
VRRWPWLIAAAAPVLALLAWVLLGEAGPQTLLLPRGRTVSTFAVLAITAALITGSLLLCACRLRAGLVALAVSMGGIAILWPAVQDNRYSGDIVLALGNQHGLHANDWLALGPAAVGAAALAAAWKLGADDGARP